MKKLYKQLERIAAHTSGCLKQYLPAIEKKFTPSTEVHGELLDCQEALEEVLRKINGTNND